MEPSTSPPSMADSGQLHIVMLPWMAFGHMIPYLELSKLIAQKGHKISFISTPRNIQRLPKLPPSFSSLINFVEISLPATQNLPENAEAAIDVPYDEVKYLKIACDGLQEPFAMFLETSKPDWIFFDFNYYWVPSIASGMKISTAFFTIFIAAAISFGGPSDILMGKVAGPEKPEDFTVKPKWVPFETTVAFRLFEVLRLFNHSIAKEDENHVTDLYRVGASLLGCDIIAIRSCIELENEWLQLLEDLHRKPAIPVGQLPTTTYEFIEDDDPDDEKSRAWGTIKEFLDNQANGSVVYVAFGSEVKPSQLELTEIALGLERSGFPFFWVFRKQRGPADPDLLELPDGFEARVKGRGMVCTSWAPQLKILSHDSVGGFLTHSGWSSVVEAIMFERALILLTFLADQGLNARVLEEKRLGYPVPRDELDGSFTSESIANSLRLVMVEEEGKIYREKVKEMKNVFADKDKQSHYVDNLLEYLKNHINK